MKYTLNIPLSATAKIPLFGQAISARLAASAQGFQLTGMQHVFKQRNPGEHYILAFEVDCEPCRLGELAFNLAKALGHDFVAVACSAHAVGGALFGPRDYLGHFNPSDFFWLTSDGKAPVKKDAAEMTASEVLRSNMVFRKAEAHVQAGQTGTFAFLDPFASVAAARELARQAEAAFVAEVGVATSRQRERQAEEKLCERIEKIKAERDSLERALTEANNLLGREARRVAALKRNIEHKNDKIILTQNERDQARQGLDSAKVDLHNARELLSQKSLRARRLRHALDEIAHTWPDSPVSGTLVTKARETLAVTPV